MIQFDPKTPESSFFSVKLDPSTINTGNNTKDKHARGKSWFHVEKYPEVTFKSTRVTTENAVFKMIGNLSIHGVEKEVEFTFDFLEKEDTGQFEAIYTIDRKDFGILGPMFGFVVGSEFDVSVYVVARKINP